MSTEKIERLSELLDDFDSDDIQELKYLLRQAEDVNHEFEATNAGRVRKVEGVLRVFYGQTAGRPMSEPGNDLVDVLADLRHFCDAHGFDFADWDKKAYRFYRGELNMERITGRIAAEKKLLTQK